VSVFAALRLAGVVLVIGLIGFLWFRLDSVAAGRDAAEARAEALQRDLRMAQQIAAENAEALQRAADRARELDAIVAATAAERDRIAADMDTLKRSIANAPGNRPLGPVLRTLVDGVRNTRAGDDHQDRGARGGAGNPGRLPAPAR
jgi:hypothetical protein